MKHSVRSINRRQAISRFLPVLSLCLIAHSFVTSVTHHHFVAGNAAILRAAASLNRDDPGRSPASGGDSECALCRLQRTPASEVRASTPLCLPSRFVWSEPSPAPAPACGVFLTPRGRAPPPA
jgi:hypothetical protein